MTEAIVLFDGVCNLCNGAVDFVIRRDSRKRFRLAALQSEKGTSLIARLGLPTNGQSIILIEGDRFYTRSTAALRITARLGGAWPLLSIFFLVPPLIRDAIYKFIARNRYHWFGTRKTCRTPSQEERERFL